jgi:hypothetical protein
VSIAELCWYFSQKVHPCLIGRSKLILTTAPRAARERARDGSRVVRFGHHVLLVGANHVR